MQPPVFFVIGPAGHGKSTAREILARLVRLKGGSCSDVIYAFLAARNNTSVEQLRQIPKEKIRPALIEAGDFLCGQIGEIREVPENKAVDGEVYRHPSALIRTLYMNGYNVIDGVRRRLELEHAQQALDWIGVQRLVIHISNPNGPKIEDNTENLEDMADEKVLNDGTVEELEAKLKKILETRFPQTEMPVLDPTGQAQAA